MKYSFFEARNSYELLVSICFARINLNKASDRNIIFSTNFIDVKNEYSDIFPNIHFVAGPIACNGRLANFVNLLIYAILNIKKLSNIYLFHEVSPLFFMGKFFSNLNIIEHGESNYVIDADSFSYKRSIYKFYKFWILRNKFIGESDFVRKVYLTDVKRCPEVLLKKCEEFNLKSIHGFLNKNDIEAINSIYNFSPDFKLNKISILLTQPFSELSLMSEIEKIRFYKKFILDFDGDILIKPHPAENTDYSIHFKGLKIIDKNIPVELFEINSIDFEYAISVNSSATKKVSAKNYIFLNCENLAGRI